MEGKDCPMKRDGKRLGYSSTGKVLPAFLLTIFCIMPIWLGAIIPLTCVWQGIRLLLPKLKPSKVEEKKEEEKLNPVPKDKQPPRKYDLVVIGCTGFTGGLVAKYLAKTYGSSIKWAICGRRAKALEAVRDQLTEIDSSLADLPILIADIMDADAVRAVVTETKVVITTAGPFARYGSTLVRSCALNGTHYCDITGESDWVRNMITRYSESAAVSGARIVHFCGHDCAPWDLLVMKLANKIKSQGEEMTKVSCYDEIKSAPSGGTVATLFDALAGRQRGVSSLGYDPLVHTPQGTRSSTRTVFALDKYLGYSPEKKAWVGPFIMAPIMANCVKRSNACLNYSQKLVYREAEVYSNFMAGVVMNVGMAVFGTSLMFPPLAYLLEKYILPAPGQGPSPKLMERGFLKITAYAKGSKGANAKAMIYFAKDPGYADTARMLVESGLCFVKDEDKLPMPTGGIWTPAVCLGDVLLQRLQRTGTDFWISP